MTIETWMPYSNTLTHYLKLASFIVFAIYNGLLTFEAFEHRKRWKLLFSALTTLMFLALVWNWFLPIF